MYDSAGRVVILHGVNAVYKHAPYELMDIPGKPFSFTATDASEIEKLGFNVVRLGILWEGLEPGTLGINSPQICTPGTPKRSGQFNEKVALAYLAQVKRVVDLLGSYGIYTLIDMHQDVYNQVFRGEGAPAWAVCTSGLAIHNLPGRWSNDYYEPAAQAAYHNFWYNDVVGNLQGAYDKVWATVASYFRDNQWVAGYDLFNEPSAGSIYKHLGDNTSFDHVLECFYTGRAHPGLDASTRKPLTCPKDDPEEGVIPTIQRADPNHLLFYEPDITTSGGIPNHIGPMPYPNLVLNFHDYCALRNPVTGATLDESLCKVLEKDPVVDRHSERERDTTAEQPGGPAWFMSEFGATNDLPDLERITAFADEYLLGWSYWSWKYYDDPTGSTAEALIASNGKPKPKVKILSQAYAEAIAGTPLSMRDDPLSGVFGLRYRSKPSVSAPTVVYLPPLPSSERYCDSVSGATVVHSTYSNRVLLESTGSSRVVTFSAHPQKASKACTA